MIAFAANRTTRIFTLIAAATVATTVGILVIDQWRWSSGLAQRRTQLDVAEEAARSDPRAAEALQELVKRQTQASLAVVARARLAALVALSATALVVGLLSRPTGRRRELPACLAARLPTTGTAPEAISYESAGTPHTPTVPAPRTYSRQPAVDLAAVGDLVGRIGTGQRHLIPLLHAISKRYHYLPLAALQELSRLTAIPLAEVTGVASFYTQFRTQPRGEHLIQVCRGTACHVAGADRVFDQLGRLLRISPGQDTDPHGRATLETVGCLGCCTRAPVVQVDERTEGHVEVETLPSLVDWEHRLTGNGRRAVRGVSTATVELHDRRGSGDPGPSPVLIRIGMGSCCVSGGSRDVLESLQHELSAQGRSAVIQPVGCVGICHLTPYVEIVVPGGGSLVATRATPADVRRIVRSLPGRARWPRRLWQGWADVWRPAEPARCTSSASCEISSGSDRRIRRYVDPQVRIVTEHCGEMDPTSLSDYQQRDGFVALQRCVSACQPEEVIDVVEASGLRGRGGGGFPTGAKWRKVYQAEGEKLLVCNGDEGDPGAFMDRMVMESYPFRVLEGMSIAAYAVGARRAFVYVRHEYPLAVERMRGAIESMREARLLGSGIEGSDFSLEVEIVEGAGAFVCGEETALLQSIMGHRGTPRLRPPYPVERGLWDQPTLVNNVETFANLPWIVRHGPQRFAALGTATSRGTKVFSLAGKVQRGGLIEIPMGLTIRQVVEEMGGGVAEGRRFKAVQIGGPSGGCIPASLADTPIDYEALREVGAIMGSGGLVVLDDSDCMVDVARYFLEFTQRESCGHCTFCRVGTRKLLDILERICAGKGRAHDLEEIESLSQSVTSGSLCGLGKTAPNPVLTTLRYFREEYEAHLQGRCPAGRCPGLIHYQVTRDCVGCTLCAQRCPVGAIAATPYRQHLIDDNLCTRCDVCRCSCPEHAIRIV
jgi:NADH-quinone oxidoreductase subunit F